MASSHVERKEIYRYLRSLEGTSEFFSGYYLHGMWNYLKYTLLLAWLQLQSYMPD
jgi:hypothetical protein